MATVGGQQQQGGGAAKPAMRKPVFTKVDQLKPGTSGHTLTVKVVSSKTVLQKGRAASAYLRQTRIAECLVGDETGTIVFTARNEQVDVMKPDMTVILRNAKIDMFKGSMRLAVDKWGRVEVAEPATFTVKEDNNLSLVEYELVNVVEEKTIRQIPGHQGAVGGLTASTDGDVLISRGADCTVRLWKVPVLKMMDFSDSMEDASKPLAVYVWKHSFWAVDHHQWDGNLFAPVGAQNRPEPITTFERGKDTVVSVRFNPGEPDVLAISARKTNAICWNPMEPMNFTAANGDCNCYSYDARKLDEAQVVHGDHVSAVMDIDYSPTGREFVNGSYDRTVRIFQYNGDHCREIYHTKRMQSDDTNLRLWKAKASEQLGVLHPREQKKQEYLDAVKERYKHLPEVKRMVRPRHLPKPIYKAAALRRTMTEAERKKDKRRAHSAPGSMSLQEKKNHQKS